MTKILARDICWAQFHVPQKVGCTKASYWARLSPETQARYIEEATRFTWLVRKLGAPTLARILAEK